MNIEKIDINKIKKNPNNPRVLRDEKFKKLVKSIQDFPEMLEIRPIVVNDDFTVLGGNMRLEACKKAGLSEVFIIKASNLTEEQQKEFIIKDNISFGDWDYDILANEWNEDLLNDWGMDIVFKTDGYEEGRKGILEENFGVPPFSVLDTTTKRWLDKREYWDGLGINSAKGRQDDILGKGLQDLGKLGTFNLKNSGISVFDPVLCEIMYKWFNIEGGTIIDPFAGGSVRGITAGKLGYQYLGNDLREEQVLENRIQAKKIIKDNDIMPVWSIGDSLNIKDIMKGVSADLFFTCPPYADLEKYSDLKEDLSNMDYTNFKNIYKKIIKDSCELLKDDRFAVIVVGEVRGKNGEYYNFVGDTIEAFKEAGLKYYNEIILLNSISTLVLRAGKIFNSGRKIGKRHQNVLVFYKGDIKKIKENYKKLIFEEDFEKAD